LPDIVKQKVCQIGGKERNPHPGPLPQGEGENHAGLSHSYGEREENHAGLSHSYGEREETTQGCPLSHGERVRVRGKLPPTLA